MAQFSKAAVQSFRLEAEAFLGERIDDERKNYDRMSEKDRGICDKKVKSFRVWYAKAADDYSMTAMMRGSVDTNFINVQKLKGKYNVKKVYELAAYLASVTGKLDQYDLTVFRTLYQFAKAGKAPNKDHLMASITHAATKTDSELVFRLPAYQKDATTASSQYLSSVTSFQIWNMVTAKTCADTGDKLFSLNLDAYATKKMIERLSLEK